MPKIYLNTFEPLCMSKAGQNAINRFSLPPYIDGSCRREPDLESHYPALSALCRGGLFIPKLRMGDKVVYLTKKGRYDNLPPHWRLVAAVEVQHCFGTHDEAAEWYLSQEQPLPKNCMVSGNPPVDWQFTHQNPILPGGQVKNLENWERRYAERMALHSEFCACKSLFHNLNNPPRLFDGDVSTIFVDYGGRMPVTQNPPAISDGDYQRLMRVAIV